MQSLGLHLAFPKSTIYIAKATHTLGVCVTTKIYTLFFWGLKFIPCVCVIIEMYIITKNITNLFIMFQQIILLLMICSLSLFKKFVL